MFETTCSKLCVDPYDKITELVGTDMEEEEFWEAVRTNLKIGKIRLLFVADIISSELQRIVEFLNGQMEPAEVLAVEIKQYVGEKLKTLVPRVVGQTIESKDKKRPPQSTKQWDEVRFMERLNDKERLAAKRILDWSISNGFRIWWGKGAKDGSFIPIYDHDGKDFFPIAVRTGYTNPHIQLQFDRLSKREPFVQEFARMELLKRLNEIDGVAIPKDSITKYPSFPLNLLKGEAEIEKFIDVMDWFVNRVKQN